jgi:hypothetical protein
MQIYSQGQNKNQVEASTRQHYRTLSSVNPRFSLDITRRWGLLAGNGRFLLLIQSYRDNTSTFRTRVARVASDSMETQYWKGQSGAAVAPDVFARHGFPNRTTPNPG